MLTLRQAERRFVGLTALRWLPIGFIAPVTVLLASARGLSPVDIGVVFTVQGLVTVAAELPTGGLADTLGRRSVLLGSTALSLVGLLLLAGSASLTGFTVAGAVLGLSRALDSGPLEAWFVDAALAADLDADTARGLSRGGTAVGLALALGAVLGGVLPVLFGDLIVLPFLVAAGLTAVSLAAIAVLVLPVGPPPDRRGRLRALREGVRDVPRTVREGVRLARQDPALRLLLVVFLGTGWVLGTIELVGPLEAAELAGGEAEGATAWSVALALGFLGAGIGSALALAARRLARGSIARACAGLAVLGAGALLLLGWAGSVALLVVGAVLFYLLNGAGWPLRKALMHSRVTAGQRATMVSVGSLALQLGGAVSAQVVSRVYEAAGGGPTFAVAAGVLLLLGLVQLRLPGLRPHDADPAA